MQKLLATTRTRSCGSPTGELRGFKVLPFPGAVEAFLLLRHDVLNELVEQGLAVHRRGVRGVELHFFVAIGQALLGGLLWRHVLLPF